MYEVKQNYIKPKIHLKRIQIFNDIFLKYEQHVGNK